MAWLHANADDLHAMWWAITSFMMQNGLQWACKRKFGSCCLLPCDLSADQWCEAGKISIKCFLSQASMLGFTRHDTLAEGPCVMLPWCVKILYDMSQYVMVTCRWHIHVQITPMSVIWHVNMTCQVGTFCVRTHISSSFSWQSPIFDYSHVSLVRSPFFHLKSHITTDVYKKL